VELPKKQGLVQEHCIIITVKKEILYAVMDHSLSVSTRIAEEAKQGGHSREEIIEEISANAEVSDICEVYQYLLKEGVPSLLERNS
jgi:flagellar biosynthesis component FlhA